MNKCQYRTTQACNFRTFSVQSPQVVMYSPKYTISNKILKNIGAIEAAKEVIENAPLVPFFEKDFKSDALARTVHHGTHIEGNDLSLDQTRQVLEGKEVVARERDIQEVINYRQVVDLLDELRTEEKYSVRMLTDIQRLSVFRIVAENKIGVIRSTQVVIRNEATGEVILKPPPAIEAKYMTEDFISWLNTSGASGIHPVLLAGLAHYVLVSIHPFIEGNGRTIRAFASLILMREKYDIKRFFSIEEHFDKDPASYYEAFKKVDVQSANIGTRDLTPWLEYFTEVLAIELDKIKERIRKLSIDSRLKLKIGRQVALTQRQMQLIEYLSENGSGVMRDLREVTPMVSEDTILRDLKSLMEKGVVSKEGSTKAARYVISRK